MDSELTGSGVNATVGSRWQADRAGLTGLTGMGESNNKATSLTALP